MSWNNIPDDWNNYWFICSKCKEKYHASEEGYHECKEIEEREEPEDEDLSI